MITYTKAINVRKLLKDGGSEEEVRSLAEQNMLAAGCPAELAKRSAAAVVLREKRAIAEIDIDSSNRLRAAEIGRELESEEEEPEDERDEEPTDEEIDEANKRKLAALAAGLSADNDL
jgi:hypothetical protein